MMPTITLALSDNLSFELTSEKYDKKSAVNYSQDDKGDYVIELKNFSGAMRVRQNGSAKRSSDTTSLKEQASKRIRETLAVADSMPGTPTKADSMPGTPTKAAPSKDSTMDGNTQDPMPNPTQPCSPSEASQTPTTTSFSQLSPLPEQDESSQSDDALVASKPPRVSIGPDQPLSQTNAPKRWGHTLTKLDNNRILVYGGQTIDKENVPVTLQDVQVFDGVSNSWYTPFNCEGKPRTWHSSTFMPERHLLISLFGESINPKTKKVKTENTVMVLDTEIMLWYPPSVTGEVTSRSGHTATLLGTDLVVFGGVKGRKFLNSISVLDTTAWSWEGTVKATGVAPQPRSYHSAVAISDTKLVVFGGNNADKSFNTIHVLEKNGKKFHWSHPNASGTLPSPRTGHSMVLRNGMIVVFGGWDPSTDDSEDCIFNDAFILDTKSWTWKRSISSKGLVGHRMETLEDSIVVFGGRQAGDVFSGEFFNLNV